MPILNDEPSANGSHDKNIELRLLELFVTTSLIWKSQMSDIASWNRRAYIACSREGVYVFRCYGYIIPHNTHTHSIYYCRNMYRLLSNVINCKKPSGCMRWAYSYEAPWKVGIRLAFGPKNIFLFFIVGNCTCTVTIVKVVIE